MKKNTKYTNHWALKTFSGLMLFILLFTSCEDPEVDAGPITIDKVYLEDVNSDVPDREVTYVRLGQLLRIEGSGFTGLKKIYVNGFSTYFNPVMVTDKSLLVSVDKNTPIVEADSSARNTIRLANDKYAASISFEVRSAAPTITKISHTLPLVGETITIFGTGLIEVNKVVFPGNIEVTEGITSDIEGEFCTVVMPEGVSTTGGSILIECSNGGAFSPAYFNFKKGVIMDFDSIGTHGYWGSAASMIKPEDLESDPVGTEHISQGTYCAHHPTRIDTFKAANNRNSEVWTAGNDVDDWRGQLTEYIPATTQVDKIGFQFDIFVPEEWQGTGYLKVCLVNGFNGGEWAGYSYNFVPWIIDGESEPYQTTGWTTITIPLNKLYAFSEDPFVFEDVLVARETNSYKNFGFYFENSDFTLKNITGKESDAETEFPSSPSTTKVYTDNWRIVSLETPEYSDFPAVD